MSLQVLARTPDRTIAGVLTAWTSVEATIRFNRVGNIALSLPYDTLPPSWPAPQAGVIVIRDGNVLASGMLDENSYRWSASDDPGGSVSLTFDTDEGRLAYRIVYPDHDSPWSDQTASSHFVFTDQEAHTVVASLAYYHAGAGALAARQVAGFDATGPGPASTPLISISERFTPLLAAMRSAALAGDGLGFRVVDDLAGSLVLHAYQPADLTDTARFAARLGNLTSLKRTRESPTANVALIAGAGEGTARDTYETALASSVDTWGRRETFIDQRSTTDTAEYDKAAAEEFERSAGRESVSADIISTEQLKYGRDWGLGDRVTVSPLAGEELAAVVTEVHYTATPDEGERIEANVGNEHVGIPPRVAALADVDERLSRIERGL